MVVWKIAGFTMIILLTGLQAIPTELQEAAVIDGAIDAGSASGAITLPLMRRTIALALILSVAGSILAFDQFYIILRGGPRTRRSRRSTGSSTSPSCRSSSAMARRCRWCCW